MGLRIRRTIRRLPERGEVMSKADKLAWLVALGVFIVARVFLSWFDNVTMACNTHSVVCSSNIK